MLKQTNRSFRISKTAKTTDRVAVYGKNPSDQRMVSLYRLSQTMAIADPSGEMTDEEKAKLAALNLRSIVDIDCPRMVYTQTSTTGVIYTSPNLPATAFDNKRIVEFSCIGSSVGNENITVELYNPSTSTAYMVIPQAVSDGTFSITSKFHRTGENDPQILASFDFKNGSTTSLIASKGLSPIFSNTELQLRIKKNAGTGDVSLYHIQIKIIP
jgi:hypothetical protein